MPSSPFSSTKSAHTTDRAPAPALYERGAPILETLRTGRFTFHSRNAEIELMHLLRK